MYMACRHIKTNGLRCKSPALNESQFCYYHARVHSIGAQPDAKYGPMHLPTPEDAASIQLAVAQISDAILNGRIDCKIAGRLLYGLQIAAALVNRKEDVRESYMVQSRTQTAAGDDLAPEERICHPIRDDCTSCQYAETCPNYHDYDADDDEDDDNNDALDLLKALAEAGKHR